MSIRKMGVAAIVTAALGLGCGPGSDSAVKGKLKIAFLTDKTGTLKEFYAQTIGAAQLALNHVNAAADGGIRVQLPDGGVIQAELDIEVFDEADGVDGPLLDGGMGPGSGAEQNCSAIAKNPAHQMVIGAEHSGTTTICASFMVPAKKLVLAPNAGAIAVREYNDDGYIFTNINIEAGPMKPLAKELYASVIRRVALLSSDLDISKGVMDYFTTEWAKLQGTTITSRTSYTFTDASTFNARQALTPAFANTPEVILFYGEQPEAIPLLSAWNKGTDTPANFVLTGGSAALTVSQAVGAAKMQGIKAVTIAPFSGPEIERYLSEFKALNGITVPNNADLMYDLMKYDTVLQTALAIAKAGKFEGTALRDALVPVTNSPGVEYPPSKLAEALRDAAAGIDINYQGLGSNVQYDDKGSGAINWAYSTFNAAGEFDISKTWYGDVDL